MFYILLFLLVFGGILGLNKTNIRQNRLMGASMLGFAVYVILAMTTTPLGVLSAAVLLISSVFLVISILALFTK
ncbi:MAG: hypothetical protein IJT91_00465 [Clostridia bacterium]|nr:hypothetical protein [Clostridia bacterium]